ICRLSDFDGNVMARDRHAQLEAPARCRVRSIRSWSDGREAQCPIMTGNDSVTRRWDVLTDDCSRIQCTHEFCKHLERSRFDLTAQYATAHQPGVDVHLAGTDWRCQNRGDQSCILQPVAQPKRQGNVSRLRGEMLNLSCGISTCGQVELIGL